MGVVRLDEYLVRVDDKYTFYGVLSEFYDQIFCRCRQQETRNGYNSEYNRHILPELGDRVLEQCEQADFEDVIEKINQGDKTYKPSTIQHYRYLIRTVVRCAVEKGICEDVLFGTVFSLSPDERVEITQSKEFVRNRKSLKVQEEIRAFNELMIDPEQSGERMGLALMYVLGLRNNEACGLKFEAIRPMERYPQYYCAWVYETTTGDTNKLKAGGKTRNAPRKLPLLPKLVELLMKRRAFLENLLAEGKLKLDPKKDQKSVDDLPIACQMMNYTEHCSSRRLTTAGRLLLRSIQIDEEEVAYIDRELQSKERRIEMGVTEKDPTAYLFRRNLGTHLLILGFTEAQIQYFMGHYIDETYAIRNDYTNEERLYEIMQKLLNRPLFQDRYPYQEMFTLSNEEPAFRCSNVPAAQLQIEPNKRGTVSLQVTAAEPEDQVVVSIETEREAGIQGSLIMLPAMQQDVSRTVNVISQYHQAYQAPAKKEE